MVCVQKKVARMWKKVLNLSSMGLSEKLENEHFRVYKNYGFK